jgi:AcrR family transcriptional regulator
MVSGRVQATIVGECRLNDFAAELGSDRPRDRRARRTRRALVQAFMELAAERGLHAVTVQAIAERADVNRATFYDHFEDLPTLVDHVVSGGFEEALRRRVEAPERLEPRDLVLAACDYMRAINRGCSPTNGQGVHALAQARVQGRLRALLHERVYPAEVDAAVASWAIFGAALDWSRGTLPGPAEDLADRVAAALPVRDAT